VALALRYRYPYLLYPLLSVSVAALSLSVFAARPLRPLRRVLEWLGRRSYELFLVHMPLVTSLRLDRLAEPPVAAGPAVALGLGAALVIAVGLRAAHARLLRRRRG
jgi:peptidoglycan/LPS O-acetylase OafA/YrhL